MHMISEDADLQRADAVAVRASVEVVARVTTAHLTRATPCADWDLLALLAHMTAQHRGFAAAAEGRGADPEAWREHRDQEQTEGVRPEPVTRYLEAADEVVAAFRAADVPDRPFALPEFSSDRTFPGRLAIGFHLVDYVVHGWDVAAALGVAYAPPADVLAITLPIARSVPTGSARLAPGAPFAPALDVPPGTTPLAEILLLLGRDPNWAAAPAPNPMHR